MKLIKPCMSQGFNSISTQSQGLERLLENFRNTWGMGGEGAELGIWYNTRIFPRFLSSQSCFPKISQRGAPAVLAGNPPISDLLQTQLRLPASPRRGKVWQTWKWQNFTWQSPSSCWSGDFSSFQLMLQLQWIKGDCLAGKGLKAL